MGILTDWLGSGRKEEPTPSLQKAINHQDVLEEFIRIALKDLNDVRYALQGNKKTKAVEIMERFGLEYRKFTENQSFFHAKGGRYNMAYQIIVRSIGPAYQDTNIYLNTKGTEAQKTSAIGKIEGAIRSLAEIHPRDFEAGEAN